MPGTYTSPGAADHWAYQPIGTDATYTPAGIREDIQFMRADQCVIVNTPSETPIPLWSNDVGWSAGAVADEHERERTDAGVSGNDEGLGLPWPNSFLLAGGEFTGDTPNYPSAILLSDSITVKEMQPTTHGATSGSPPSSSPTNSITAFDIITDTYNIITASNEVVGSHGGSGLSALFGTIRLGEFNGLGAGDDLGHVLKIELDAEEYYDPASGPGGGVGYRWPAHFADGCAPGCYGSSGTPVSGVQPGALLALLPGFDHGPINTLPGHIIANTFERWGARICDSTSFDAIAICTELGPSGSVRDDFGTLFGHDFNQDDNLADDWGLDMAYLVGQLQLVTNDSEATPGGGGDPIGGGGGGGGTLTWSFRGQDGLITLEAYEAPHDGSIRFNGGKPIWARFNPVGYEGELGQYLGREAAKPQVQVFCGEVTKNALMRLIGPTLVVFTAPRPYYENGINTTIDDVEAVWTKEVPGEFTQAQIDANLTEHPTGDGFGWYLVTVTMTEKH